MPFSPLKQGKCSRMCTVSAHKMPMKYFRQLFLEPCHGEFLPLFRKENALCILFPFIDSFTIVFGLKLCKPSRVWARGKMRSIITSDWFQNVNKAVQRSAAFVSQYPFFLVFERPNLPPLNSSDYILIDDFATKKVSPKKEIFTKKSHYEWRSHIWDLLKYIETYFLTVIKILVGPLFRRVDDAIL